MQLFGGELNWWQGGPPWDRLGKVTRCWPEARGWCSCGPTCEQGWKPLRYPLPTPSFSQTDENGGRQRALRKDQGVRMTSEAAVHFLPKATTQEKSQPHYLIWGFLRLPPSPFISLYIFLPPSMIFFFHKHLIYYPVITILWPWTIDLNLSFWIWKMETITSCSFERIKWVDPWKWLDSKYEMRWCLL